jgi:DNA-binding transcriptional regulator YiaG
MENTSQTKLARFIKDMGLKKKQFATRIGVSDSHLSRWLRGHVVPHRQTRVMIEIITQGEVPADGWQ